MARFPKIDQPCPLDSETQRRIQGDCARCGKTVHCLDGKSDAERTEFMRRASGPVCVSYRLGIGAALALSMAGPVVAADETGTATNSPPSLTVSQTPNHGSQQSPLPNDQAKELELELVFVGGISRPDEAEWIDEDEASLPELPMRREEPAQD